MVVAALVECLELPNFVQKKLNDCFFFRRSVFNNNGGRDRNKSYPSLLDSSKIFLNPKQVTSHTD